MRVRRRNREPNPSTAPEPTGHGAGGSAPSTTGPADGPAADATASGTAGTAIVADATASGTGGTAIVADLIHQLEAGSGVAATRLRALARQAGRDDRAERASVLDRVAASAAAGSPWSLELLVALVVELDLAGAALTRVAGNQPAPVVDDIRQEVLVAVARSIHRYRGDARFTTWLYTVASNVAVSHLRRIRPTVELGPEAVLSDGARRRMSSVVSERDLVWEAIRSLPPQYRTTVQLRDIEGLSYAEIAERQGVEINTVRSRLARGRALMARRMP